MAVTLRDIAERTGVSPSVVSTVLSGRDNGTFVSETTRRKVLQVAESLNYTPVRSGRPRGSRRLRRQRTEQFIGIWDSDYNAISAYLTQQFQVALTAHVRDTGTEAGDDYGLRLLAINDLPKLDSVGVMGIILLSSSLLPREAASATIPCVMIGEVDNPPRELAQVHVDNFAAGRDLAEHLWGLGHRAIAYLAPGAHPRVSRQRFQGMKSVWIKRQIDPNRIHPAQFDSSAAASDREQIRRTVGALMNGVRPRPTALICETEYVAAFAAQALVEMGVPVPGQVSLVAVGDTPQLADLLSPALTTIRLPVEELAEAAIDLLYDMHDDEDSDNPREMRDVSFHGQLIVRGSSGPAPGTV
jgi:LacI family transcriptional regulator